MSATQIIVLGMHRSGTSAIAGLLDKIGLYFGSPDNAIPISPCNEKGFWERGDVVIVDDALLAACGCKWDCVVGFDPTKIQGKPLGQFQKDASAIIAQLDAHSPWFIKDPRMCITFPLWRPLLKAPVCLLVYRNPLQVARSLRARHDCSTHTGLALWEQHTLAALESSANLPRMLVRYEDFIEKPAQNLRPLVDFLTALGMPGVKMPSDEEIGKWLDAGLFHQRTSESELKDHLNAQQMHLYEALKDGSALQWKDRIPLSPQSAEILEYHAIDDRSIRDQLVECRQARGYLKDREAYLLDAVRQMGAWSADMEKCLQEITSSLPWKISSHLAAAIAAIAHPSNPRPPAGRLVSLLKSSKDLSQTILAPPPKPTEADRAP